MSETLQLSDEQIPKYPDHYERVKRQLELDPSRVDLNANYVLNRSPEAVNWVNNFRDAVTCDGLYPPPDESGLHITGKLLMADIASRPDYPAIHEKFAARLSEELVKRQIGEIQITLTRPHAEGDGVISFIKENKQWEELIGLVNETGQEVIPDFEPSENPGAESHVTLAYGGARNQEQQDNIQRRLNAVECQDECTFSVDCISLVEQLSDPYLGFYLQESQDGGELGQTHPEDFRLAA